VAGRGNEVPLRASIIMNENRKRLWDRTAHLHKATNPFLILLMKIFGPSGRLINSIIPPPFLLAHSAYLGWWVPRKLLQLSHKVSDRVAQNLGKRGIDITKCINMPRPTCT